MNTKKLMLVVISAIILLITSPATLAKEFNYDYVQLGVGTGSYKSYDDEYYILASKSIDDNISVRGSLIYYYGDWNDPGEYEEQRVNGYSLEGVYHTKLTTDTDLLTSVQFSHTDYKLSCTPTTGVCGTYSDDTPSFDHYTVRVGARHNIEPDIEIEGQYNFIKSHWTNSSTMSRQARVTLMKEVFDKTSVGAEYTWGLTGAKIDHYGLFVRKSF